ADLGPVVAHSPPGRSWPSRAAGRAERQGGAEGRRSPLSAGARPHRGPGTGEGNGGRSSHRRGLSRHDCGRCRAMNIAQQIVNGLVLGSGYACVALGWTILLGVARLVNFAHGQLYMLAAFVTWYAMTKAGLPYPVAILVAIIALAILGALLQVAMTQLVMTQNLTSLMIVTLGFGYVLQGGSALIF